ncbi:hypothetical protein QWJ34_02000 [Saccharibacillus sp. CPCC 101409]|uniref:hypothetical protein n=1 Tax=Saccharibacillus sp. CPCC 101409 TaxID=3058041 RepID=UPI00267284C9|nr:hypothetical protein [Saccharibacillus sp. CPCC 101409]MDO3408534.1 hypothetical protein [Saccharibacillus sp. CPCC 101409]
MHTPNTNMKKIMITVNGEPVGSGLLLDSVTFRPLNDCAELTDPAQETANEQ